MTQDMKKPGGAAPGSLNDHMASESEASVADRAPARQVLLDWRDAKVGEQPLPCVLCGRLALLREPGTGVPKHKVCAEAVASRPAGQAAA